MIGPYRLEQVLGEGGMGKVFRAVRESDGTVVALKVVRSELAGDEQHARRFRREARAASEVDHRHLVGVLDAGEAGGRRYLAMRFISGRSLDQRIEADGPLSVGATVQLACEIGAGIDALHAAGLVHRDIKPSNIMLEEHGGAALTDFGLAKSGKYSEITQAGQVLGTLDYLAPEAIRGHEPGPAADIYALGCVVFECLAGRPPFGHKTVFEVGLGHLEEPPPDPCAARPESPAGFASIVLQALAKAPAERPPTATAYARTLSVAAGALSS